MRLAFLPINQCWAFLFGEDVATAQIISMDGAFLFASRKDAVAAANRMDLGVARDGTVS